MPEPTATPTLTPYVTAKPTAVSSETPSASPAPTVTPYVTVIPTETPMNPTAVPTASPTPTIFVTILPSITPTASPTVTPVPYPTVIVTIIPSDTPTATPTMSPTLTPTVSPSPEPTASPTPTEEPFSEDRFELLDASAVLQEGDKILILGEGESLRALSNEQTATGKKASAIRSNSDGTITPAMTACILTLQKQETGWALYDAQAKGYLCAASSSDFALSTESILDDNGIWTIALDQSGIASLAATGSYLNNRLCFHAGNGGRFVCKNDSDGSIIRIARFVTSMELHLTNLGVQRRTDGKQTVRFGATIPVSELKSLATEGQTVRFGTVLAGADGAEQKAVSAEITWIRNYAESTSAKELAELLHQAGVPIYAYTDTTLTYLTYYEPVSGQTIAYRPCLEIGNSVYIGTEKEFTP